MRRVTSGTTLALTLTGATALATASMSTAYAYDVHNFTPPSSLQASTLDFRVPLNADVYHAFLDAKLDRLGTYVDALRAKVAAIPSGTVLVGEARFVAKHRLAKAASLSQLLAAIPASGQFAPTSAELAQIAGIRADLSAIVTKLKALLANRPAAVTPTTFKSAVARTLFTKDHVCDGHFGTRYDGTRWSGWTWWHHR